MTTEEGRDRSTAVVTGASRGLGSALSRFLGAQGFELVLNARDPGPLEHAAREISEGSLPVHVVAGDISQEAIQAEVEATVRRLGRLDLLVNNASELGPSPLPSLAVYPIRDLERVLEVNLLAPLRLTQRLLPELKTSRGRVVNISSDAAVAGYPGWGGYGASKAALDLVSLTLAHELKGSGVSVVSVDPGDMRTTMHQAAFPGEDISDRPVPEVTLPFWAWLLNQDPGRISGHRFRAQSDRWEVPET
jgi:NAD(P)-dependent dehydrogenase (short-subunit alcohol dehydrogenase family)